MKDLPQFQAVNTCLKAYISRGVCEFHQRALRKKIFWVDASTISGLGIEETQLFAPWQTQKTDDGLPAVTASYPLFWSLVYTVAIFYCDSAF